MVVKVSKELGIYSLEQVVSIPCVEETLMNLLRRHHTFPNPQERPRLSLTLVDRGQASFTRKLHQTYLIEDLLDDNYTWGLYRTGIRKFFASLLGTIICTNHDGKLRATAFIAKTINWFPNPEFISADVVTGAIHVPKSEGK